MSDLIYLLESTTLKRRDLSLHRTLDGAKASADALAPIPGGGTALIDPWKSTPTHVQRAWWTLQDSGVQTITPLPLTE